MQKINFAKKTSSKKKIAFLLTKTKDLKNVLAVSKY